LLLLNKPASGGRLAAALRQAIAAGADGPARPTGAAAAASPGHCQVGGDWPERAGWAKLTG
jgi:hypothetical protein